jgi:BMFP domain-containing protein YqiC
MQTNSKILDDVAKVLTGAAGAAQGVRDEIDGVIKTQLQRLLSDMDLVSREEFDVVKSMAALAREENDKLSARIDALEAQLKAKPKRAAKKTTAASKPTDSKA